MFAPFLLLIIIMAPKRSFVRHITFALFLIITSPRLLSGDVLLFYLLHHPDCCRMMYCYSIIISITSPPLLSGDVLLFYYSSSYYYYTLL